MATNVLLLDLLRRRRKEKELTYEALKVDS